MSFKRYFIKQYNKLPRLLRNKYILVSVVFVLYLAIGHGRTIIDLFALQESRAQLEEEKDYYNSEIEKLEEQHQKLETSKEEQIRIAREEYLMKRPDEDIFIIERESE